MFLLLVAPALAECPRMFDTGDILKVENSAESVFKAVNRPVFVEGRAALESRTACAATP